MRKEYCENTGDIGRKQKSERRQILRTTNSQYTKYKIY